MQTNLKNISGLNPPAWCINGHVHTIAKSLLHHPQKPACERIVIPTPDDDFLELDVIDAGNRKPVITLFHGLEGSSSRYYIIDLMQAFSKVDYSVVALNFRGCGSRMNRQRRFYHSGETEDLMTVFSWIDERFPHAKRGALGFSLGGNVLLKSLGERGGNHPLDAAVAISVPYALKAGSLNISHGFNRIYESRFLKSLTQKINQKRRAYPNLPVFSGSTLYQFDDQVTAPLHGFEDAEEYYSVCSSDRFVGTIEKPTLLIHSKADPLCPVEMIPFQSIEKNANLDYIFTEEGGYVGFWGQPPGWLSTITVNYFADKFD